MIRVLIIAVFACALPLHADPAELTQTSTAGFVQSRLDVRCSFSVGVRQVTLDKVVHKQKYYHGHYDDQHQYVCSGVSIALNGRKIEVPEAAYCDLCFLQSVAPPEPQEDGTWMVRIDGGSGGESYKVELIFNDTKLLERRFGFTEGTDKITEIKKF